VSRSPRVYTTQRRCEWVRCCRGFHSLRLRIVFLTVLDGLTSCLLLRTQIGGRQHGRGQSPLAASSSSLTIKSSKKHLRVTVLDKNSPMQTTRYKSNDQHSTTSEKQIEAMKTRKTRYCTACVRLTPKRTQILMQLRGC